MSLISDEVADIIGCVRNQDAIGHEERTVLVDTLEEFAWRAELYERLYASRDGQTQCAVCEQPATCIGWSTDTGVLGLCDDHCGHGNEDSICHPVIC